MLSARYGTNSPFALGADAAQHHQRVGERAQEDAEGKLVAAVAGEVAQQPRPHLAGGQGERGDGDREHRAGDADRGRGHRAEQGPRAGRATVVQPRAVDQPLRHDAAAVDRHHADGDHDTRDHQGARHQPEGVAERGEQLADVGGHAKGKLQRSA